MEKRDLYNSDRIKTGETIFKGENIPKDRYILVVLVFIENSEGKFLIQKRSKAENGKYATTGGHPKSGETSLEGILTEVEEELGLKLNSKDLTLYCTGKSEKQKVFWDDYYIKLDIPNIENLKLQKEEVEKVVWLSKDEIIEYMEQGKFFEIHYEAFKRLVNL